MFEAKMTTLYHTTEKDDKRVGSKKTYSPTNVIRFCMDALLQILKDYILKPTINGIHQHFM